MQLLALKNTYDDIINKKSTYDITNSINNTNSTNITATTTTTASSSVSHRQSQSITQLNSTAPITSYIQDNLIDYYDDMVKVLFINLKNAYHTESKVESDFWLDTLISKPIIWIRKQFIEPYRIAFQHFINFPLTITTEPFLYIIDSNSYHHHYEFKDFMKILGIRDRFDAKDLSKLTRDLYMNHTDIPLSSTLLTLSLGIIEILYNCITHGHNDNHKNDDNDNNDNKKDSNDVGDQKIHTNHETDNANQSNATNFDLKVTLSGLGLIYLPNNHNILRLASTLTYDDAPWLTDILSSTSSASSSSASNFHHQTSFNFVHSKVNIISAKELGCKSLREQLFTGEEIICPDAEKLHGLLDDDSIKDTLNDLLHIADKCLSSKLQIYYDETKYPEYSLLYPGLAETQGTSLVAYIEGPILNTEQLVKLLNYNSQNFIDDLHPSTNIDDVNNNNYARNPITLDYRKKFLPASGKHLTSAFVITDCLQIISGNKLFIFDPCGNYLVSSSSSSSTIATTSTEANSNIVTSTVSLSATTNSGSNNNNIKRLIKKPNSLNPTEYKHVPIAQHFNLSNKNNITTTNNINNINNNIDTIDQFPDQFASFLNLPYPCSQTLRNERYVKGVIIRMPLRKQSSLISGQVIKSEDVRVAFGLYTNICSGSLLFATKLREITLSYCSKDDHSKHDDINNDSSSNDYDVNCIINKSSTYNNNNNKNNISSAVPTTSSLSSSSTTAAAAQATAAKATIISSLTTTTTIHIPDISIKLISYPIERLNRLKIVEMKGWEKHGLTKLFSKAFIPPEVSYSLLIEIQIKSKDMKIKLTPYLQLIVDDNNNCDKKESKIIHREEWLISAINGFGRVRDLAIAEPYCSLSLQPFVTIAAPMLNRAQLKRFDIASPTGIYYRSAYPNLETYLPFHIEGNFIESRQQIESNQRYVSLIEMNSYIHDCSFKHLI